MGFLNIAMLFGLAAVAIPVLIHLLHRRRFDVVEWGAMQFLRISETRRRRLLLDEILLLAVRMGLVALLVLALARPFADASLLGGISSSSRFTIFVIDGSYSMGHKGTPKSPFDQAREWVGDFLATARPGDEAALLLASATPKVVVPPTRDLDRVRAALAELPAPDGLCDWPEALRHARTLAKDAVSSDIVILRDRQRFGWADDETLVRWKGLAGTAAARTFVVDVGATAAVDTNYAVEPLQTGRAVAWAGQPLRFRSSLNVAKRDSKAAAPRLHYEVNGKRVGEIATPTLTGDTARLPLSFTHRFTEPGPHIVALVAEVVDDTLPGDNRQELAVEVVQSFPVLLVDGDTSLSSKNSTYFLSRALAVAPDAEKPALIESRVVVAGQFDPTLLSQKDAPRVLVLADVAELSAEQEHAVSRFVKDGGGVLVVAGARLEGAAGLYNTRLFRHADGWLPGRLDQVAGDADRPEQAATLDLTRVAHPILDAFRAQAGTLAQVRFPRWWKTTPAAEARTVAHFSNGDPFLVERPYGKGRVLLCTVPLDRSWGSSFPSVWEYPVFVHEAIAYLAGTRTAMKNRALDLRESDLSPASADERTQVASQVGLEYVRRPPPQSAEQAIADIWWLLLIGVSGFLCFELWLTRRIAVSNQQTP